MEKMDRAALFSTRPCMHSFDEKGTILDFTTGRARLAAGARADRLLRRGFRTLNTFGTRGLLPRNRGGPHQPLQRVHIHQVVERFVDWGLRDECRAGEALIVEQAAEGL